MRRVVAAKTAARFRPKVEAKAGYDDDEDDNGKTKLGAGQNSTPAQQVVRAIYDKWQLQLQRWADYRSLFSLMAFIAVFLGVLYAQRGATIAYQVHSTIASVVVPGNNVLQSTDDVYSWLQGLLGSVWTDPTCGDGICEAPFEFASFSRFGCKADCGRLSDIQNLTTAQVDVYWDFTHQAASLPAADLMSQVSWNLCPQDIQYNTDCYDDPDNTFSSIAGSLSEAMPDLPDGDWALVLKKDIFFKTRGAVRDSVKLSNAASWFKIYIAAAGAAAEQAYELSLLNSALGLFNRSMIDALPAVWADSDVKQAYRDAFDVEQMRNATCLCDVNVTDVLAGTIGWTDTMTYLATNCSGITQLGDRTYDSFGNASITYTTTPPADVAALQALCDKAFTNLTNHRASFNSTVQKYLVVQRLGNLRDTGKFAVRYTTANNLKAFLNAKYPELVSLIYTDPKGADPHVPAAAALTALMNLYVESDAYLLTGAPAHLALYRRRLNLDPNITFSTYATRTIARIAEIAAQQASVRLISIEGPNKLSATIADITAAFTAAGANTTVLPASPKLGHLAIDYNLAQWDGNTTAYLTCNLDIRGPEYLGTCVDLPVMCTSNPGSDTNPYNCTMLSDGSSVPGSIRNATYRVACEVPCDKQLDCGALCECWDTCSGNSYCSCKACEALHSDAAQDNQFFTIKDAAASSGAASTDVIADTGSAGRRRLLQSSSTDNITAQLAEVLVKVGSLRTAQDSISGQMTALQGQVDKANLLAEARAANTKLQDLITAGRSDIQQGQTVLEGKLNTLLDRQQAAIDAMNAANSQIAAVKALSERQADAIAALDAATNDRLNAISVATQQGVINLYQALAVWKMARRDRALSNKITKLAGQPCTYEPVSVEFTVDNLNGRETNTARERTLGLNNRVLAGLFLHTWRATDEKCPESRFSQIQTSCAGQLDVKPFGVDSVFKLGSVNFNPDLYDPDGAMLTQIYNCSEIPNPAFDIIEPATKLTVNPSPYCAELFNPRQVPYAFWHLPLKNLPDGFPVFLDINLSEVGAQTWLSWIQEGLLLDDRTQGLVARLISYNAELKVFAAIQVNFDFQQGGSIKVTNRIYTLSLELYDATPANLARYAFEVMLAACIVLLNLIELWDLLKASFTRKGRRQGSLAGYLSKGSVWLELTNNVLLLAGVGLWWTFVNKHAKVFSMDLRYQAYSQLQPQAYFLKLANSGAGLQSAWEAFSKMEDAIAVLNWYYALNGISILLLIARLLCAMDFQPRLGVVTRALQLAAPDLLHFFLVAGSVFICYCMMGFLIFGNSLSWFATFGASVNTCFEMLLGEFADVNADLRALGGLQSVAGALFFWSFELLVFLILLNFLLAIIVDAFSEIKGNTHEQTGIHVELARLLLDKWRWFVGTWTGRYIGARTLDQIMREWAGIVEEEEAAVAAEATMQARAAARKHRTAEDGEDEPKILQVMGETVDEAALAQILMAVLQDDSTDDPKAAAKDEAAVPPAGEVEAAARFIIQRFGKSTKRAAEEALKEMGPGGQELEEERDKLAAALERLAGVQRELAEAQRNLMMGQKQLAQQQTHLVGLITQSSNASGPA